MRVLIALLMLVSAGDPVSVSKDQPRLVVDPNARGAAIDRGLDFLLREQLPDGSWRIELGESRLESGMRIAITALCMDALTRYPGDRRVGKAVADGLAFIRANTASLDSPFDASRAFNFNLWGMAFGLKHLHEAIERWPGRQSPDVDDVVDALVDRAERFQLPCGGWSYIKSDMVEGGDRQGSVSFMTSATLEGLIKWRASGTRIDDGLIKRGLRDLEQSFARDERLIYRHYGRYGAPTGGGDSAGRSVQGRLALAEAGVGDRESIEDAITTFFAERHEYVANKDSRGHEPPTMIAGYYYYYVHHYVARALRHLGTDSGGYAEILRSAFVEEQRPDGSWMDTVSGGSTCGTAFVLIAFDDLANMIWRSSLDDALAEARRLEKPVLLFLSDQKKASTALERELADPDVAEVLDGFICVKSTVGRKDPVRKKTKAGSGAALAVLNADAEDPLKPAVKVLKGARRAKALVRALRSASSKWEEVRTPE